MSDQLPRRRWLLLAFAGTVGAGASAATCGILYLLRTLQTAPHSAVTPTAAPILTPAPPIITRADWGARQPNHEAPNEFGFAVTATDPTWYTYPGSLSDSYNTVVIHHSALSPDETMRDIQDLHMDQNGWADVGYHYGIDKDGLIYEGREIHVRGVSVAGYNTGVIGVVVMGHFVQDAPAVAQLVSLQTLVNWLALTCSLTHLAGHNEFNLETVCPGANLSLYLDWLAQGAFLQRGTGGYVPPA